MYRITTKTTKFVCLISLVALLLVNIILQSFFSAKTIDIYEKTLESSSQYYTNIFNTYLKNELNGVINLAKNDFLIKLTDDFNGVTTKEQDDFSTSISSILYDQSILLVFNDQGEILLSKANSDLDYLSLLDRHNSKIQGNVQPNIFLKTINGRSLLMYTAPIIGPNGFNGIVLKLSSADYLIHHLTNNSLGGNGSLYLVSDSFEPVLLYSTGSDVPINFIDTFSAIERFPGHNLGSFNNVDKLFVKKPLNYLNYNLIATFNMDNIYGTINFFNYVLILCNILFLLLSIVVFRLIRNIATPLKQLEQTITVANNGDFSVRCPYQKKNEFGIFASNLNHLLDTIQRNDITIATKQNALTQSEERYRVLMEGVSEVIWEWNLETGDFFASSKWQDIFHTSPPANMNLEQFVQVFQKTPNRRYIEKNIKQLINKELAHFDLEFTISHHSTVHWVLMKALSYHSVADQSLKVIGTFSDITVQKHSESKLYNLAYYDRLTSLHNRYSIEKILNQVLTTAQPEDRHAVMLFDLDDFKTINDAMGHHYGDRTLSFIGRELNKLSSEKCNVARFGGDEFFILLTNYENQEEINTLLEAVFAIIHQPITIEGFTINLHSSLGIALYPEDGINTSTLMKHADIAMYKAKQKGKNQYHFFTQDMFSENQSNLLISHTLQQAVEKNYISLVYQPIYDLATNRIHSLEVLTRLYSPELGPISPAKFIPLAEEKNLIVPIGYWIIEESCKTLLQLNNEGHQLNTIAINISIKQLEQPNFVEKVTEIFQRLNVNPNQVEFEITESVLIHCFQKGKEKLVQLKELGVIIALDDFGAGYSSFNYLGRLPIDILKVDKLFVDQFLTNENFFSITESIVELANKLNLETIAEGIETKEQYSALQRLGFAYGQGYYMSRPLSHDQLLEVLNQK